MMKKQGTYPLPKGEIEMAKEPKLVVHYTVYMETGKITEKEATNFPVKLMQTVHHAFPGLRVHIIREPKEEI
jgi:hypothetical protein